MRIAGIISLILLPLVFCGCNLCCCGKRASELRCPTDIRKTQCWCLGEDAIFSCPCGPDSEFYGYQPTCWRGWPAGGAEWRDARCPAPPNQDMPRGAELRRPALNDASSDTRPTLPNPFRGEHPVIAAEGAGDFVGEN